jgi:hypothetical protein
LPGASDESHQSPAPIFFTHSTLPPVNKSADCNGCSVVCGCTLTAVGFRLTAEKIPFSKIRLAQDGPVFL